MKTARRDSLSLCCGLLLLLAACGGDDSGTSNNAPADASAGGNATGGSGGSSSTSAGGSGGGSSTGGASGTAGMSSADGGPSDAPSDNATTDANLGPLTINAGAGKPTGIALSATAVYWADETKNAIYTCPKSGCGASAPSVVVATPAPRGIALRGATLYWIGAGPVDGSFTRVVYTCQLNACTPALLTGPDTLQTGGPFGSLGIAVNDQKFYTVGGPYAITCPVTGCGDAGSANFGIINGPSFDIALDSKTAYFAKPFYGVAACPLTGCSSDEDQTLLVPAPYPKAVAVDDTNVYWSEYYFFFNSSPTLDGAIRTCPLAGCTVAAAKVLAAGAISPYAMAVDATNVYYTDYQNGRVERITKNATGSCIAAHFAACEACTGMLKCDGACNVSCDEAGAD